MNTSSWEDPWKEKVSEGVIFANLTGFHSFGLRMKRRCGLGDFCGSPFRSFHLKGGGTRISTPACTRRTSHRSTELIMTERFPFSCSAIIFRAHCTREESGPTKGGLTQFRFPQSSMSPLNPGGLGYGHGSKSKWNSASSGVHRSGGVSQYPTLSPFPGMRAICFPFMAVRHGLQGCIRPL